MLSLSFSYYLSRNFSGLVFLDSNSFGLVLVSILARLYAKSTKEDAAKEIDLYKMHKARRKKFFHFFLKIAHFGVDFGFQSMLQYERREGKPLGEKRTAEYLDN